MDENGDRLKGHGKLAVKVWIDFVCPFCFLAEKPLGEALDGLDVEVEWMPFELRPYPQATLRPEDDYLPTVWRRSVYPMAERMGIPIRLPSVSPQPYSRAAFEGMQFAAERGRAAPYVDGVMRAFFQRDLDIGKVEVLQEVAAEAGLPADELAAVLADSRYAQAHQQGLEAAHRLGVRAVPTIVAGQRYVEGMPDPTALRRVLQQEIEARRPAASTTAGL